MYVRAAHFQIKSIHVTSTISHFVCNLIANLFKRLVLYSTKPGKKTSGYTGVDQTFHQTGFLSLDGGHITAINVKNANAFSQNTHQPR